MSGAGAGGVGQSNGKDMEHNPGFAGCTIAVSLLVFAVLVEDFFGRLEKQFALAEERRLAVLRDEIQLSEKRRLAVLRDEIQLSEKRRLVEIRLAEERFDARFDAATARLGLRRVSSSSGNSAAPTPGNSSVPDVVQPSQALASSGRTISATGAPGSLADVDPILTDACHGAGIRPLSVAKAPSAGADVLAGDVSEPAAAAALPVPAPSTRPVVGFVKR